jgi:predicted neuraminidase
LLFYKVGETPSSWWAMLMRSTDDGLTWSKPMRLPDGVLGPVKNKPVQLPDGSLLCGSSSERSGWRVYIDITPDLGRTWTRSTPLNDGRRIAAIQPTILRYPTGHIQILCRTRQSRVFESWSMNSGHTWSALRPTDLPNPNSGIDGVVLRDGRAVLVYNHSTHARSPLNLALSLDGELWKPALTLEGSPGEYSYPAVIQTSDGLVHITYTWRRLRIKHVTLDPQRLSTH